MAQQTMACIVGAGPAGLAAAKRIQERGWQATVIEEHPKVGDPVACTGLISASGVHELGIRKEVEGTLLNKVRGAKIFSPSHEMLEDKRSETVAYVINRGEFDRALAARAYAAGVQIKPETKLIDIRNETVFIEHKGRGELLKTKVLVGADGVNSKARKIVGINTDIKNYVHAYQVVAKGHYDPNYVQVYFGDYAKNYFAWIVPENEERARVGLASTSGNIRRDFEIFTRDKNVSGEFCDMCSKLIPCSEPLKKIVKDNILLVGDAAHQTKATTGGGIILGMLAGNIAGDSVHRFFKDKEPLENYEKSLAELNHELTMHWKMRQFMNNKSEGQIDDLIKRMNKAKAGEFLSNYGDMDKPSKFLGKAMATPSLWRMFPEAVKFMIT